MELQCTYGLDPELHTGAAWNHAVYGMDNGKAYNLF